MEPFISTPVADQIQLDKQKQRGGSTEDLIEEEAGKRAQMIRRQEEVFKKKRETEGKASLTQMALMSDSWPVKVCRHMPSRTSQSLAEASQAPETNNLVSGARERLITSPV